MCALCIVLCIVFFVLPYRVILGCLICVGGSKGEQIWHAETDNVQAGGHDETSRQGWGNSRIWTSAVSSVGYVFQSEFGAASENLIVSPAWGKDGDDIG